MKRDAITRPTRRAIQVEVPELGGTVHVRDLLLSEWQSISTRARAPGENLVADALALAVVDDDGVPIFDAAEWEIWGGQHRQATTDLINHIFIDEKKTTPT